MSTQASLGFANDYHGPTTTYLTADQHFGLDIAIGYYGRRVHCGCEMKAALLTS
ncbi:MAG: hypothetical protein ACYDEP_11710 [Acidimicrobiales bacterium]